MMCRAFSYPILRAARGKDVVDLFGVSIMLLLTRNIASNAVRMGVPPAGEASARTACGGRVVDKLVLFFSHAEAGLRLLCHDA